MTILITLLISAIRECYRVFECENDIFTFGTYICDNRNVFIIIYIVFKIRCVLNNVFVKTKNKHLLNICVGA